MPDRDTAVPTTEGKPPSPPPRRSRSRSPPRKSKKTSGFKWKQKPSNADVDDNRRDDRRSRYDDDRRGPSSRSNYRDDYRRDRDRDRDGGDTYRPRDRDGDRDRDRDRDRGGYARRRSRSPQRDRDRRERSRDRDRDSKPPRREKKEKAPVAAPAVAADGEEMIIVHVNDRLGTKAAIPCFGSDNVGAFKVMVAARIGREPHEILLKRQGERPFKDHITLGDYGVSNGVQLDLEVDTGD
ncbi:Ubiquitin-like modifier HUB1 [Cytospora mali]|uniref:Ubiquitin-like modifier HUB1 n=1 Tax=Cytospora mali TaxID=578113 RepID=A0A194VSC7_CYTMA|nr:Ubiquitin-like modifier HUB1 [Valsa mali]